MQQTAPVRGPLVWRDMDQKTLDDAYDQAVYAPNRDLILARIAAASETARNSSARRNASPTGRARTNASTFIAPLHPPVSGKSGECAGQCVRPWRRLASRQRRARPRLTAEAIVRAGAHAVVIDFINVGQTGGDLMPMAEQVAAPSPGPGSNAESFGGDRGRFYVSAHSSGAHLAACALSRGWRAENLPADFCKGALLVGGMYDLEPVRLFGALGLRQIHRRRWKTL